MSFMMSFLEEGNEFNAELVLGCMEDVRSEMVLMACCWVTVAMDRASVSQSGRVLQAS
jgi:hypothetical protein